MSKFTSHLDKALGFDGAAKLLAEKGINALNNEFRKRGEQAKAKKPPFGKKPEDEEDDEDEAEKKDWEPLLSEMLEGIDTHQKALDDADTAHKQYVDASDKRIKSLEEANETLVKQLTELQSSVKAFMADTPRRASEASETKLTEAEEKEAKDKIEKRTTQYDPAFPGMNVPLKS